MTAGNVVATVFFIAGAFFFFAGTVGILRFPDVFTRLHAVTKADNLGLGLVTVGLVFETTTVAAAVDLVIVWLLVLLWSSAAAQILARDALDRGEVPWETRE